MPDLLSLNPRTTDLVNLTPHAIRLYHHTAPDNVSRDHDDFIQATIPPSGRTARLTEVSTALRHTTMETYTDGDLDIRVESVEYGQVVGLPDEKPGVLLIVPLVTALAALAAGGRDDLLVPWRQVRDTGGTVVGCRAFAHPFSALDPELPPTPEVDRLAAALRRHAEVPGADSHTKADTWKSLARWALTEAEITTSPAEFEAAWRHLWQSAIDGRTHRQDAERMLAAVQVIRRG